MTLYFSTLRKYSQLWHYIDNAFQKWCINAGIDTSRIKAASEKAMLSNLERLISNIKKCNYYFELEACKALYEITLKIPFPEYYSYYNSIVTTTIERKEQSIKTHFNHSK